MNTATATIVTAAKPRPIPRDQRATTQEESSRQSRNRAQWIEWGLPSQDARYYSDWIYESLPPLGEFSEAELIYGWEQLSLSERSTRRKLADDSIPAEQRAKLNNVLNNTLGPQLSLFELAIERIRGNSVYNRQGLCESVGALLSIFDEAAPVDEALDGVAALDRLFRASGYRPGCDRLERLRKTLTAIAHAGS